MEADAAPTRSIAAPLRAAWTAGRHALSRATRLALDIALPTLCVSCHEPVDGEGVCAACWARLSFIERPYCPRLGIPFVYDPGPDMLSMEAIASPPAYQRARAGGELLADADMLVPVPLHWRRAWRRRYNQSGALARIIARQSGVKSRPEVLRRVRATEQQIGLSRAQRATNVQGAFQVSPDRQAEVQGRRIILVDDVLTSGATLDACARALLRARAAQVDVLVFARVVEVP